MDNRCLIIAEAGVNHNGDVNLAFELCKVAKEAGADVVKFQTWKTENIITQNVAQAEYQKENTGKSESQFDMLKRLELSQYSFKKIKEYCDSIGIIFASTADDLDSLDFLISIGIPFIKIGSGDIGNIPYLRYMGSKKLPVILSTGMSSLSDIDLSLRALKQGGATDITILHCTTSYPCSYSNVNLKAMLTLKDAFKVPVGYSDHTMDNIVPISAVALGACVIEKHFTLDRSMEGPDHKASIEPRELADLISSVRNIESAMGNGIKEPTPIENENSKVILKRIVAKKDLKKGRIINEDDICVKRNDSGIPCNMWDFLVGTTLKKDYSKDEGLDFF